MNTEHISLLTDFYELTMMQGYYKSGIHDKVIFDMFYRKNPSNGGYAICSGLEQIVEYIKNLRFTGADIDYLRKRQIFDEDFLEYLSSFRFSGDIYAVPEGSVVFPMEPLLKVVAPIMEAQLIETAILNIINHQSLISTKASRVCYAAKGRPVMEFGLRRAQGPDAGVLGARAAIIGGCSATSNVLAAKNFDIDVFGTHAHSWVMSFPDEYTAFKNYASIYPTNIILLVDTYDVLHSGIPNAIRVFEELKESGKLPEAQGTSYGIRIDSGDLAYLSKKARKMLNDAGFRGAKICVSSDLDEYLIESLINQGAEIDTLGVGTNLITSKDCPAFGGVYKLSAIMKDGEFLPKIKVSESQWKITNPGNKTFFRIYDKETGKIRADIITLADEVINENEPLEIFDQFAVWKRTKLQAGTYTVREMLQPVFLNGDFVGETPSVLDIKAYCNKELNTLWDETRRFSNPQDVYVDLSQKLFDLKQSLLDGYNNI